MCLGYLGVLSMNRSLLYRHAILKIYLYVRVGDRTAARRPDGCMKRGEIGWSGYAS